MTNYERYRESIDLIIQRDTEEILAFNKKTNEVAVCQHLDCEDCLFHRSTGDCYCNKNAMKWLVAEYTEYKVDWSKIPIDTTVLVSDNEMYWYNSYFAGVDETGRPLVYPNGRTSWSNENYYKPLEQWNYTKLVKV
jgi:hypothetical protein